MAPPPQAARAHAHDDTSAAAPESKGGWFARRAKEFLLGTPVEPVDPAKIHIAQVADEVYNPGSPNASAIARPSRRAEPVTRAVRGWGDSTGGMGPA